MIGRMSLKPSKLLKNKIYPLSTSSFSPSPSPPRLTLEHLWPLTVLVGVFSFTSTHPIRPQDFWWHIAIGRSILQTGAIPTVDTYSFTALGQPYASYQMFWLPETALYGLYTSGGPALVVFVYSLLITAAYALLLLLGWQITRNWRAATVSVLLAAAVGINDWNVRPQGITFLLGALLMMAIHWMRTTRRSWGLLIPPLCLAIWANSHGAFPLGLALIGVWLLQECWDSVRQRRRTPALHLAALSLALAILACLFNPRGVGIFSYVSGMTANPVIQNMVPEWAPPRLATLGGKLFYFGLLCSVLIVLPSARRLTLEKFLIWSAFAVLGLRTARGSVWFGLATAPIVAEHLSILLAQRRGQGEHPLSPRVARLMNTLLLGFLVLLTFLSIPWFKALLPLPQVKAGLISQETPIAATEFLLRQHLPGRLFHTMSFGSYLAWAAQPDYPVFVDSRIELYPLSVWQDYLAIGSAQPGWQERLARYEIEILFLSPSEHAALIRAAQESGWQPVYIDRAAAILTKP